MYTKVYTLVLVRDDVRVLLGFKKRGFGQGKWNGFGGKVEPGETVIEAALRELKEESGISVLCEDLERIGVLTFQFMDNPEMLMEVHVFATSVFQGNPIESEEMIPKWFSFDDVPFDKMWADDKFWFPLFLSNKKFEGKFVYEDSEKIIEQKLDVVSELP